MFTESDTRSAKVRITYSGKIQCSQIKKNTFLINFLQVKQ